MIFYGIVSVQIMLSIRYVKKTPLTDQQCIPAKYGGKDWMHSLDNDNLTTAKESRVYELPAILYLLQTLNSLRPNDAYMRQ